MGEFCIKVDFFDGSITAHWAKIGLKKRKNKCVRINFGGKDIGGL